MSITPVAAATTHVTRRADALVAGDKVTFPWAVPGVLTVTTVVPAEASGLVWVNGRKEDGQPARVIADAERLMVLVNGAAVTEYVLMVLGASVPSDCTFYGIVDDAPYDWTVVASTLGDLIAHAGVQESDGLFELTEVGAEWRREIRNPHHRS